MTSRTRPILVAGSAPDKVARTARRPTRGPPASTLAQVNPPTPPLPLLVRPARNSLPYSQVFRSQVQVPGTRSLGWGAQGLSGRAGDGGEGCGGGSAGGGDGSGSGGAGHNVG